MAECVAMDYCLVKHFMEDSDFYEGVRALLVDKDKSPKWQPESLALVSEAKVADYFESNSALNFILLALKLFTTLRTNKLVCRMKLNRVPFFKINRIGFFSQINPKSLYLS